uniref:Uncharacterized protein n=1 Tax=Ananas comosus var. bracteatus TaxID=296719 RepID=A0A6V7PRU3_ANACO|nr:unnamed protein product [Ananas comosus var. bracteatus]
MLEHQFSKEGTSQISEVTASPTPDPLETGTTHSSLGQSLKLSSSTIHHCHVLSKCEKENIECCVPKKVDEECELKSKNSGIGQLDLNAVDVSSMVEDNSCCKSKLVDTIECSSTTGPLEESEPLRMWKEMKQNGFLSSLHGGVSETKQRGRKPKKRKDDVIKKKIYSARKEQVSRLIKVAAPSGLLSGLNPGIINHVRNSKQVRAIIEAMVQSEKLEGQNESRFNQTGKGREECIGRRKDQINAHDSSTHQFIPSEQQAEINQLSMGHNFYHGWNSEPSLVTEDAEDGKFKQKIASNITTTTSVQNFSANLDNTTSLSLKAANVALHWLDLLQQDIKGRLDALRRSEERVRNAIHTELPYLLSTEFSSGKEIGAPRKSSLEAGCLEKAISESHMTRWRALFSQIEKALDEEARYLVSIHTPV